ncbi:hypothetical protein MMC13_006040 [Lambiella insularis]|nr:hypothetical protein [Lambiella insularis]
MDTAIVEIAVPRFAVNLLCFQSSLTGKTGFRNWPDPSSAGPVRCKAWNQIPTLKLWSEAYGQQWFYLGRLRLSGSIAPPSTLPTTRGNNNWWIQATTTSLSAIDALPSMDIGRTTGGADNVFVKSVSPTGTTVSSSTKRKRAVDPKYYSVRVGHHPGIYHNWAECLRQVKGFKNATFKSFSSLTDAEQFLAGQDPGKGGGGGSSPPYKFYAVKSGRTPGIYTDWPSAQRQVTGWTKPKHKCFSTKAEAQQFLGEIDQKRPVEEAEPQSEPKITYSNLGGAEEQTPGSYSKKFKKAYAAMQGSAKTSKALTEAKIPESYDAGIGPLPPGAEDGFDPDVILDPQTGEVVYKTQVQGQATKLQAIGPTSDHTLRVHTDGSSLRNGQEGAFAGVGVYFGPNDERNLSEVLQGPRQTNQRAELTAILRALDTIPKDRDVIIVTDSRYAIDCVTLWYMTWRKNGWKTSAGKAVENRDLVENILGKLEERNSLQVRTTFEWIKGHADHPGNMEADMLAVTGARRAAGQLQ